MANLAFAVCRGAMRIMARAAPQFAAALAGTSTLREFFGLRHCAAGLGGLEQIRHSRIFERLAGMEIVQGFAGIQNPRLAFEVALFAHAVSRRTGKPGGIHYIAR